MNPSNLRECELWLLMEFSANIATRALMNGHITLALSKVTEPYPLVARSGAPDQRKMRHSLVPGRIPNQPHMKNLPCFASFSSIARVSQDR